MIDGRRYLHAPRPNLSGAVSRRTRWAASLLWAAVQLGSVYDPSWMLPMFIEPIRTD